MPARRRTRRTRFLGSAVPQIHDQPPPRWTGVPVERDPRTGRLLRDDPSGREGKFRAEETTADRAAGWRVPVLAATAVVVLALGFGGWLFTERIGGEPTPASGGAAVPTSGGPASTPTGSAPGTTPGTTTAEVTTPPTTGEGTTPPPPPPLPPGSVPAAPSGLTAMPVDSTAILLSWTDNSTDESGFEIGADAASRAIAADAREYLWDGLEAGQQVCFRIRAVGEAGPSAWHPETSASPVCATTPAEASAPAVDLAVTGVDQLSEDVVCAGSSPAFLASFTNAGSEPSGAFAVRWLLDGAPVGQGTHAGLPAGASDVHEVVVQDVPEGQHEVRFVLDPDGQVAEGDETNNEGVVTFAADYCVE